MNLGINILLSFILGVLSSILATYIVLKKVRLLPKKSIYYLGSKLLDCDIDYVYDNEEVASDDILLHATNSDEVRVLSNRGNRLTTEERKLSQLISPNQKFCKLSVLIGDPDAEPTKEIAIEFDRLQNTYTNLSYKEDVRRSVNMLRNLQEKYRGRIFVRTHCLPNAFRLLFTDNYLFLSFFSLKGVSASRSRVYRIKKNTFLYDAFDRYFRWAWANYSFDV